MFRIAGINLPENKRLEVGLTYVYGIGKNTSKKLIEDLKLDLNKRIKDLSEAEKDKLREKIEKTMRIEGDLRRIISQDIKRLKEAGTYRGMRHKSNLPVRGQRTKTNARTKKGKRIAVGGNKIKPQKK